MPNESAILFSKFVASNKSFWHRSSAEEANQHGGGYALLEASMTGEHHLYGILKVGLIFARIRGLTPLAVPGLRSSARTRAIIRSMVGAVVRTRLRLLGQLVRRGPQIVSVVLSLRTGRDLVGLKLDTDVVGPYVYDSVIGRFHVPTVKNLTWKMRVYVAVRIAHYHVFRDILDRYPVRFVSLNDPPYVCGLLFELCRRRGIPCINAINIDILQIHKYYERHEFDRHCRQIERSVIDRLPDNGRWSAAFQAYMDRRINGDVDTHDVSAAYGSGKQTYSRDEVVAQHCLDPNRPTVVVMAHVFADAPHICQGLLYLDYHEWLMSTVTCLADNPAVNILVKEHPASHIYGEANEVRSILRQRGLEHCLLRADSSAKTVLDVADYIITCAGTIALEAAPLGIPVVVAARSSYSGLGFALEPATAEEYETLLRGGIQNVPRLSPSQRLAAAKAAYVRFELFDNSSEAFELGGAQVEIGRPYDKSGFYQDVISTQGTPLEHQLVYKILERFERSSDTAILNEAKLQWASGTDEPRGSREGDVVQSRR